MQKAYDHFRKLALETSDYLYYANSRGYIERLKKSTVNGFANTDSYVFEKVPTFANHKHNKTPNLSIMIGRKQYSVKHAIMRIIGNVDVHGGQAIIHLDGDYRNCSYDNLKVVKKGGIKNPSWVSWELEIHNRKETYETTQELCQRLGVSYWALRNYLRGMYTSNHWLNDYTIRRIRND